MDAPQVFNRPFSWDFVLQIVENRLGMWVGRPTYERAVALIVGFDMAQAETIHDRMQARIRERHGTGPLGWEWVLMAAALGRDVHAPGDLGPLTAEEDDVAVRVLVAELREVLAIAGEG